jgi:hypothetical protein
MPARNAWRGIRAAGRLNQSLLEQLGIGLTDSNGGKYSCLVSAARMIRVQAVILKLAIIHDRTVAIRQLHLETSVSDHCLLTNRSVVFVPLKPRLDAIVTTATRWSKAAGNSARQRQLLPPPIVISSAPDPTMADPWTPCGA